MADVSYDIMQKQPRPEDVAWLVPKANLRIIDAPATHGPLKPGDDQHPEIRAPPRLPFRCVCAIGNISSKRATTSSSLPSVEDLRGEPYTQWAYNS